MEPQIIAEPEKEEVTPTIPSDGRYRNKQRCLTLANRGVTSRYRHLLEDLRTLLPHHKKDSKLDAGHKAAGRAINEIAEIQNCNSVLFLECKKRQDAYMWIGLTPNGPSAKFHLSNVHTMDELRMTGNCMRGSRPVLTFDDAFDEVDSLKLLKTMFVEVFGTPRGHPKSKPFVDRVMGFYYADGKIWVRNYQILEQQAENAKEAKELQQGGLDTSLVEIGPRFVLNPIKIFGNSFGGPILYANQQFITPNQIRSDERKVHGTNYLDRKRKQKKRKVRDESIVVPEDPLASVFK